jgi:hypothetical protein
LFDRIRLDRLRGYEPKRKIRVGPRLGPFGAIEKFAASIAEEILHDPILERVKRNDSDARARLEAIR